VTASSAHVGRHHPDKIATEGVKFTCPVISQEPRTFATTIHPTTPQSMSGPFSAQRAPRKLGRGEVAMGGLGKRLYAACGNATYLTGRYARELSASRTKAHFLCASRMSRKRRIEFHRCASD
jgi:hypothetical protein